MGWKKEIKKHDFVWSGGMNFVFVSCHFRKLGKHVELLDDKGEHFRLSMRLQLLVDYLHCMSTVKRWSSCISSLAVLYEVLKFSDVAKKEEGEKEAFWFLSAVIVV